MGQWENWRNFLNMEIEIIELEIELFTIKKEQLKQALNDYKDY